MTAPVSHIKFENSGQFLGIRNGSTGTFGNPAIILTALGGGVGQPVSNIKWEGTGAFIGIQDGSLGSQANPAILLCQPFSSGGTISAMKTDFMGGNYLAVVGNGTTANPYKLVLGGI